ncbi:MAG: hypothetical protein KDC98_07335 [Planctomycetes bacterium]|nr:hypothetical protein [Planctomycetota bacterium]
MLKFLQERVNTGTKEFDQQTEEHKATAAAQTEAEKLSGKQGRVQDLMRKLATKLNKENHVEEGR